jgi:hypothetical protein
MKKVLFFFIFISAHCFANKSISFSTIIQEESTIFIEENVCELPYTPASPSINTAEENYYCAIEQLSDENTCAIDSTQEYFKGKSINISGESMCSNGSKDAELYHDQNLLFGISGFILSWPAIVVAAVYEPEPNKKAPALSGNPATDNFEYRQCYASKAKNKNIKAAVIGAVSQLGAIVLLYAGLILAFSGII